MTEREEINSVVKFALLCIAVILIVLLVNAIKNEFTWRVQRNEASHVTLSWKGPKDLLLTYNIYRADASNGKFIHIGSTNELTFTDYYVIRGHLYYYQVRSKNLFVESEPTAMVRALVP